MDIASRSQAPDSALRPHGVLRRGVPWLGLPLWLAVVAGATIVLSLFREQLPTAHVALAYLLLILVGSALQGRVVGLVLSVVTFLAFNFFLLPPYYTFAIRDPLNWWVLVAFLATGAVAAELFHRAQRALDDAEERARELDRLAALGAEGLAAPRAIDAVHALAGAVRTELGIASCRIVMAERNPAEPPAEDSPDGVGASGLVEYAVQERRIVGLRPDGTSHVAPRGSSLASLAPAAPGFSSLLVPLQVRDAVVGVLVLADSGGLRLSASRARFGDALAQYAALAVERVRLSAASEHVAALREADHLKDAVLASVSHDLRTPLTTIRALAAELRATGDHRAAVIEEEAERLNRMVTDLLDLSRIRSGALPTEPQLVAAEDLVGALLQRLEPIAGDARIRVRLPAEGSLLVGSFDFVQSLRALGNLVENALAHSTAPVDLEVREEAGELVFAVLDRGPGIPDSERELIFEPFFSGRREPGAGSGTGLGLPIARSLAEAQSGSVRYAPRPGGGAVFELRLPAGPLPPIP